MAKQLRKKLLRQIGDADPIISMGQRAYELIAAQWPSLVAFFATGSGVTILAVFTDWARTLGPLGIGLIVIAVAGTAYLIISVSLLWTSKRQINHAHAEAIEDWKNRVDSINPLSSDFNRQRISINDLANPINGEIEGKKFVDCELIGPANITLIATSPGSGFLNGVTFVNCDIVVYRVDAKIQNTYVFIDSKMLGGKIFNCTVIIHPSFTSEFIQMGANIITFTGNSDLDNQISKQ